MRTLLLLLGLGIVTPPVAQTSFTYREVRDLKTPALARLMLGAVGERAIEHRIVVGEGSFRGPPGGIVSIDFAGSPRARYDRTCEVEHDTLGFEPISRGPGQDPPVRISGLRAGELWAVLPSEQSDCATLGPALEDPARPGPYFTASDGGSAAGATTVHRAVTMLRSFLADPAGVADYRCALSFPERADPRQNGCAARTGFAALLDTRRLGALEVRDCHDGKALCVTFRFDDPGGSDWFRESIVLNFVTTLPAGEVLVDEAAIQRVRITKESWIV